MAEYEVAVYITDALYNYGQSDFNDGFVAQKRARKYIQGAFDRIGHSVSFLTPSATPNAPTQKYDKSFTTACPCDIRYNCSYGSLLDWFKDWIECNNKPQAADSNLLLSNKETANGGNAYPGGIYAHSQTGKLIARLPDQYHGYGYKKKYNGMETGLHEIAHNLMGDVGDEDQDGAGHHDVASAYGHSQTQPDTISAMEVEGSTNDCGYLIDTSNVEGYEMLWSDCCVSNWE